MYYETTHFFKLSLGYCYFLGPQLGRDQAG